MRNHAAWQHSHHFGCDEAKDVRLRMPKQQRHSICRWRRILPHLHPPKGSAMLVLSRRVGDEITLPELGVTIRLLNLRGKVAKLGVDAPKELSIRRSELAPHRQENHAFRR